MAKNRFLFASVDSPPNTGGVSLLATRLSNQLMLKKANEGVYVAPKGSYFERNAANFKFYEDLHSDTRLRAGPRAPLEDERIADLFIKIIKSHKLNRIVLWHPFYYGLGGIEAAKECDIPISVFVHGTELTSQLPEVNFGTLKAAMPTGKETLPERLLETIQKSDLVLTNSSYSASLIRNANEKTPISIVGCGIDEGLAAELERKLPSFDTDLKRQLRLRYGLVDSRTMVAVGRLVPHKNHVRMLDLLAAMPDWHLYIVGDGPEYDNISRHASDIGVSSRVTIRRNADDREKFQLMRAADLGLLLSNYNDKTGGYEGFGIVMLEYASAGCVPVTSGQFGMKDFSIGFNACLITLDDERDASEHAQELLETVADEEAMAEKLAHARAVVRHNFTWGTVADKILEAWEH